ncbi:DUF512 domain-containing protein, partial [Escherichia coli]|uniref:DUF512 domain-containing protein n=1 Tax=Escherichia coli TaxID=562 RepID=UPI002480BD38
LTRSTSREQNRIRNATIVTGLLFADELRKSVDVLNNMLGTSIHVIGVQNLYFGGDVSVAGLLTGSDILAIRAQLRGDRVILPETMIKSDESLMLDGMRLDELERELRMPVMAMNFDAFADSL